MVLVQLVKKIAFEEMVKDYLLPSVRGIKIVQLKPETISEEFVKTYEQWLDDITVDCFEVEYTTGQNNILRDNSLSSIFNFFSDNFAEVYNKKLDEYYASKSCEASEVSQPPEEPVYNINLSEDPNSSQN